MSDDNFFIAAKSIRDLRKLLPDWQQYAKIVRVTGGYHVFRYWTDYETWRNQR